MSVSAAFPPKMPVSSGSVNSMTPDGCGGRLAIVWPSRDVRNVGSFQALTMRLAFTVTSFMGSGAINVADLSASPTLLSGPSSLYLYLV
jgi:hypothetical protein